MRLEAGGHLSMSNEFTADQTAQGHGFHDYLVGSSTLAPGQTHHVVATYDGTTLRLYVDGVANGQMAATFPASDSPLPLRIGATGPEHADPFQGTIDEAAVYDHALTIDQVRAHLAAGGGIVGGPVNPRESAGPGPCSGRSVHGHAADPVDTASGNFYESATDLSVPGRGVPLSFARTYNSMYAATDGPLGFGWTHAYAMSLDLSQSPGTVVVNQENGCQSSFFQSGSAYGAAPRVLGTLVHNGDGTWTFTRRARDAYVFNAAGQLISERDLNGYVTSLAYNGSGQLATITDPAGRSLTLAYSGTHATSLTDTASPARVVRFAYNDGAGNLTDVTDAGGGVTHFTYDTSHRLLTMLDPNQAGTQNPVPRDQPLRRTRASGLAEGLHGSPDELRLHHHSRRNEDH